MKDWERMKALPFLAAAVILLGFTGVGYRQSGFAENFWFLFALCLLAVPTLMLLFFRRAGTLPSLLALGMMAAFLGILTRDASVTLLIWAFCLSVPLVLSLAWPRIRPVKQLVQVTLPAAMALDLAGVVGFCGLRYGEFSFAPLTQRIPARLTAVIDWMEAVYKGVYSGEILNQLALDFQTLRTHISEITFVLLCMVVYALFGAYFFALYAGDRWSGSGRWSGNWAALIPGSGISMLYMLGYIFTSMLSDPYYQVASAVFTLFGFFYVFTAVRRLRIYLRRKRWPSGLNAAACGALLVLSYLTAGGALISAYTILLLVGWWFAASPRRRPKPQ